MKCPVLGLCRPTQGLHKKQILPLKELKFVLAFATGRKVLLFDSNLWDEGEKYKSLVFHV